ncbi:hypothetical protein FB451DRAFT_1289143, partial [Mycena latifolia]
MLYKISYLILSLAYLDNPAALSLIFHISSLLPLLTTQLPALYLHPPLKNHKSLTLILNIPSNYSRTGRILQCPSVQLLKKPTLNSSREPIVPGLL